MRFDRLQDWLSWQESLHPSEIELGLERIRQVWQKLQQAEFNPVVITIAGTNGKGSCGAMLESILLAAHYRVGYYSSPHLVRYNERIRLQAELVSDERLCEAFDAVDQARADISITYFEFGTLAALYLFQQAGLDAVILEVGMGGRLDAVNIIDADCALLTSVGLDHQDWLGPDRESIGREKAGVFRGQTPAVCAEAYPPESVTKYAAEIGAKLFVAKRDFSFQVQESGWSWQGADMKRSGLPLPALRGEHQLANASAVLMVLAQLADRLPVQQQDIRQGLMNTSLPGRFQIVSQAPVVVLDVAHNPHAVAMLKQNLQSFDCQGKWHVLLGMLADKDVKGVAEILKLLVSSWSTVSINATRGQDSEAMANQLADAGIEVANRYNNSEQALLGLVNCLPAQDCLLVMGSFYVVADALQFFENNKQV